MYPVWEFRSITAGLSPQNDLERQLCAAQEGQIPPEDFLRTLLGSEVLMPIYEKHQLGIRKPAGTSSGSVGRRSCVSAMIGYIYDQDQQ